MSLKALILYRADYPSEALIKKLASEDKAQQDAGEPDDPESLDTAPIPAPAAFGLVTFSSELTKKAAEKAGNLVTEFNLPVYDAGQIFGVLDRESDKEIQPFPKGSLLTYGYQIITAGALCKELAVPVLYVPSYREDDNPIPIVAVVVKFARKVLLNATGSAVNVISPFSELTEAEIKEVAKSYV